MKRWTVGVVVVLLVLAGVGQRPAEGQITWGANGTRIVDPDGILSFPPGGEPTGAVTDDTLHLTGDAWVTVPSALDAGVARVEFYREFSVGPLPVEIQPYPEILDFEFKIAVGNGNSVAPTAFGDSLAVVRQTSPFLAPVSPTLLFDSNGQVGNGTHVAYPTQPLDFNRYVLSPGLDYEFVLALQMSVSDIPSESEPISVITYEFGGISDYEGLSTSLPTVVVPEPSSIIACCLIGVTFVGVAWLRRRRKA